MKTIIDTEKPGLDGLEFVFDERDAHFSEEARAIIAAAHEAGLASARALVKVREAYPEADAIAREFAPQIFAQSVGASLGMLFGKDISTVLPQVVMCANVTTMDEEKRAEVIEAMTKAAETMQAAETKARH